MEKQDELSLETVLCYGETVSDNITVKQLLIFLEKPANPKLANFVYQRLYERYIAPFEKLIKENNSNEDQKLRLGFSIMANMCLLIETLQTFKEGWVSSDDKSAKAFRLFFSEHSEEFNGIKANVFHKNIRCGILHQGETTGGWRINHGEKAIDIDNQLIDASKFLIVMEKILTEYKSKLLVDNKLMDKCIKKIKAIIDNCNK